MRCEVCGEHIIGEQITCPYCSSVIRRQTLSDKGDTLVKADRNFDLGHYTVSIENNGEEENYEDITRFSAQKNNGKQIKRVRIGDAYISAGGNNDNAYSKALDETLDSFEFGSDDAPSHKVQLNKGKLAKGESKNVSEIKIPENVKSKQYSFKDKKKITLQKQEKVDIYEEQDSPAVTFEQVSQPAILKSGNTEIKASAHAIGRIPGGIVLPQGITKSEFIKVHQLSDIRTAYYVSIMLMYFYALLVIVSSIIVYRHPLFLIDAVVVLFFTFFMQTRFSVKLSIACFIYSIFDVFMAFFIMRYIGFVLFVVSLVSWVTLANFDKQYQEYLTTGVVMERK